MEEQQFVDSFDLIDMRLNNRIQEECKLFSFEINFPPLRNKINNINNLEICNKYIINFIKINFNEVSLNEVSFNETSLIEIQANEINYGIKINENIYINTLSINTSFKEIIKFNDNKKLIISRNFNTFHQTDDNIRKYLYTILVKFIQTCINVNFILLGGEMYIFAHLIKKIYMDIHVNIDMDVHINSYSDFQSIVNDTPDFANPILINYDTFILPQLNRISIVICNTSKSGLTNNMSEQIINNINYIKYIILIECSNKSNKKLKLYLENNLLIEKIIKYKINYCIISLIKLIN